MQKVKIINYCTLFITFIPYVAFAHSGHGNVSVSEFMHQALHHTFFSWELWILLICMGLVPYAWTTAAKKQIYESLKQIQKQ